MVVMVGIDVHKDTHCAVATDEAGRQVGRDRTFRATDAGHRQLLRWALSEHGAEVRFAVEDCRHVSTRLERALLGAGRTVVRVPPKLMALTRQSARTRGKSDPIDALNIARAAAREPDLPRAEHTHASRTIKLLVDHREDLVRNRTAIQSRVRWLLHELDPAIDPKPRGLDSLSELDRVRELVAALPLTAETAVVVRIVLEQLEDIRQLTVRAKALEKELRRPGRGAGAAAALPGRLRSVDRREDRRRDREPGTIPLRGLLRDARRCRPDPREQRAHPTQPAGPRRQPAAQRRVPPHRSHPGPIGLPRTGLLPASQE
jgi:transposase